VIYRKADRYWKVKTIFCYKTVSLFIMDKTILGPLPSYLLLRFFNILITLYN
jgi:hypothetical protein